MIKDEGPEREYDATIWDHSVKLEIVIPEVYVWGFLQEYGKKFATKRTPGSETNFQSVHGCYPNPLGWHITVVIWEKVEQVFYDFLREFYKIRSLTFGIYKRSIELEVVVPKAQAWAFIVRFGKEFTNAEVAIEGIGQFKEFDRYYVDQHGWHFIITIWDRTEEQFYDFMQNFCHDGGISWCDPRI